MNILQRLFGKKKVEVAQEQQFHKPFVSRSYFPDGTWVKAKRSGGIRYVTRQTNSECFEDDGKLSGQAASPYCHYDDYEAL